MHIIDKVVSNFKNNKLLYIGEKITISEHMIQSAMLAEKAKCNDDIICSCLLHDYGHFIIDDPDFISKAATLQPHKAPFRFVSIISENSFSFISEIGIHFENPAQFM